MDVRFYRTYTRRAMLYTGTDAGEAKAAYDKVRRAECWLERHDPETGGWKIVRFKVTISREA